MWACETWCAGSFLWRAPNAMSVWVLSPADPGGLSDTSRPTVSVVSPGRDQVARRTYSHSRSAVTGAHGVRCTNHRARPAALKPVPIGGGAPARADRARPG